MCLKFTKPEEESRPSEPAHSKGHLSPAALPKTPFHTAWEISYARRWNTEPSVTTLGHSLELCIPWCKHPLEPTSNTSENRGKLQEESKGRQELFARFPGYLCASLAALRACSILHVLSRGSWLLTQMLCEFLGCRVGRERDKARGKTHARTAFTLLFTIIAGGCHWLTAPEYPQDSPALAQDKRNPWKT